MVPRWGVRLTYSLEEQALGTAGGVKKMAGFFDDGPFVVWYGDNLSRCRIDRLADAHCKAVRGPRLRCSNARMSARAASSAWMTTIASRVFWKSHGPDEVFSHWVNAGIYLLRSGDSRLDP